MATTAMIDLDDEDFRTLEHRVLLDMSLITRWRAKQCPEAPGWTRSAGTTSASIEDTAEGRDPLTHARVAKIGLGAPPPLAPEERARVNEQLDARGREYEHRLSRIAGDERTALERIVAGVGSQRTHSLFEIVGVALATRKELAAWKAAGSTWLNAGARGRPVWYRAVGLWCGVKVREQ